MTGICGLLRRDGTDAGEACARMRQALKIYGPHRQGQWDGDGVSFGIQLFRMLPEDRFDRQPLVAGDGRFVLVADVRLDNRPELAAELGWTDADTRNAADADYVLAAWEKWGAGALNKLIGDWAIAVWDREARTITLARDMMGMRPLFYHRGKDFFAFASMVKGLHALPEIPIGVDYDFLKLRLALASFHGPAWYYQGISKVEQGGKAVLHADGRVETALWYDWSRIRERSVADDDACIAEFRDVFDRAVSDRLRGCGHIGSHLSSGFDSTAVTVTAAGILAETGKRLAAFTHVPTKGWRQQVPKGRCGDEGPVAAATAAAFPNIDHVQIDSGDRLIAADLDADLYYAEVQANVSPNGVWGTEILRRAKRLGVSTLLTGGAGNFTVSLTGIRRLSELIRDGRLATWLHEAVCLRRNRVLRWRGILYQSFAPWMPRPLYLVARRLRGNAYDLSQMSLLNPRVAKNRNFLRRLAMQKCDPAMRPAVSVRQDAESTLRNRTDHTTAFRKGFLARHGIQVCDPTCDRRLIEFSLSLPSRMWLRDGVTKWLYRQAFRGRVPDAVMNAKLHGYQSADWPERVKRSKPMIDAEIDAALMNPQVSTLLDAAFLRRMRDAPLPDVMNSRTYQIKLLRGLGIAYFIRRTNRTN